jgi:hypothetical protein
MKRILFAVVGIFIFGSVYSQSFESTIRKFNIGVGIHTDIWMDLPSGADTRTINQGAQVNGLYSYRINESSVYIAGGVGFGFHNLYSNSYIPDVKADSISMLQIPDNIAYKKSKIALGYFDIPLEFRIKTRKHFRVALGFKAGFLINAHTKYKGNRFVVGSNGLATTDGAEVKEKEKDISQVETWRYGPTFRIGYKWFNVTVYYQLSKVFKVDKGPQVYPISVGIAVIPY